MNPPSTINYGSINSSRIKIIHSLALLISILCVIRKNIKYQRNYLVIAATHLQDKILALFLRVLAYEKLQSAVGKMKHLDYSNMQRVVGDLHIPTRFIDTGSILQQRYFCYEMLQRVVVGLQGMSNFIVLDFRGAKICYEEEHLRQKTRFRSTKT